MFNCKGCCLYKTEIERLQRQNDELTKKLMALVDARAFSDVYQPVQEEKKHYFNAFGEEVRVAEQEDDLAEFKE